MPKGVEVIAEGNEGNGIVRFGMKFGETRRHFFAEVKILEFRGLICGLSVMLQNLERQKGTGYAEYR